MNTNPLLAPELLPQFSKFSPSDVLPAIELRMNQTRGKIENLLQSSEPRNFTNVMALQETLEEELDRAFGPASHLHSVMDSPQLREVYGEAIERLTDFQSELGQNRELFQAVQAVRENEEFSSLKPAQQRLIEHALRDFKLSGVALAEPARTRFRDIASELSKLSTEFEQAVLDATDAWFEDTTNQADLSGVPESSLAMLQHNAKAAGVEGYRVNLKQPSYVAIMTYADNRALRQRVYTAYATRASDQGPHAGQFDNTHRIERILALRHEAAELLGFHNAAEESLVSKMASSCEVVLDFLRDLATRAKPGAQKDWADVIEFAQSHLQLDTVEAWDLAYVSERLKQSRFQLSDEDLKPYFALDAVLNGLFAVAENIFAVRFKLREGVDVWHPDVRFYDVFNSQNEIIAGMYLDLFARNAKRGGAWMDVCRTRCLRDAQVQIPIAYLTCNFAPPTDNTPSLLTHDDVITMFHEFGHGLHHMLTEQVWPSISGISGVEWDAVELPSQFMENFCWSKIALDSFAKHWQSGAAIPNELFDRLLASKHFQAGLFLVRQLEFALFDFRLHREFDPNRGARVLDILQQVRAEVTVVSAPNWQRFPHSFGHIFAGGYAAGYYSYLWAEVLSADAFSKFEIDGVFNQQTGAAYRKAILAVGGSRPALESFIEFRGRAPNPDALLKSYNLS